MDELIPAAELRELLAFTRGRISSLKGDRLIGDCMAAEARRIADRLEAILKRPRKAASEGYYLACFKHGPCGGYLQWWGPNNCGYTPDLDQAGVYGADLIKPGYHDSDVTVPVPVALAERFRVRRMVDVSDTLNAPLASAETLRAWIDEEMADKEVAHG